MVHNSGGSEPLSAYEELKLRERSAKLPDLARIFHTGFARALRAQGFHAPSECQYYIKTRDKITDQRCPRCDVRLLNYDDLNPSLQQPFVVGVAVLMAECTKRYEAGDASFFRDVLLSSIGEIMCLPAPAVNMHAPMFGVSKAEELSQEIVDGLTSDDDHEMSPGARHALSRARVLGVVAAGLDESLEPTPDVAVVDVEGMEAVARKAKEERGRPRTKVPPEADPIKTGNA